MNPESLDFFESLDNESFDTGSSNWKFRVKIFYTINLLLIDIDK